MEWMLGSPALAVSYRWQAGGLPSCSTAAAVGSGVLELPTLAVWRKRTQGRALTQSATLEILSLPPTTQQRTIRNVLKQIVFLHGKLEEFAEQGPVDTSHVLESSFWPFTCCGRPARHQTRRRGDAPNSQGRRACPRGEGSPLAVDTLRAAAFDLNDPLNGH